MWLQTNSAVGRKLALGACVVIVSARWQHYYVNCSRSRACSISFGCDEYGVNIWICRLTHICSAKKKS